MRSSGCPPASSSKTACTGWRAQFRFVTALPEAFVPNAVGTSFVLAAALIIGGSLGSDFAGRSLADNARAVGASEAEITEAVEVGYLYGGTAALVMGVQPSRAADRAKGIPRAPILSTCQDVPTLIRQRGFCM